MTWKIRGHLLQRHRYGGECKLMWLKQKFEDVSEECCSRDGDSVMIGGGAPGGPSHHHQAASSL